MSEKLANQTIKDSSFRASLSQVLQGSQYLIPVQDACFDVTGVKYISMADFVTQLDLEQISYEYLKKHAKELGSNVYVFRVTQRNEASNKSQEWIIYKRFEDFIQLEKDLKKSNFKRLEILGIKRDEANDDLQDFVLAKLEKYLQQEAFTQKTANDCAPLREFLQIGKKVVPEQSKLIACYLKKKAGGRFSEGCCTRCGICWGVRKKRWFVVTSECITYQKSSEEEGIREMIIFDRHFECYYGKSDAGYEFGIRIVSAHRQLQLEALSLFDFLNFLRAIQEAQNKSPYLQQNVFESFAPQRERAQCKWYIDGSHYFDDVANYLERASKSIFITDWWLSPHFFLRRPVGKQNKDARLDQILQRAASRGVSVFIIHWQEHSITGITNNSSFTQSYLESLSPNIKVLRHPNYFLPYPWSHHEKMVVVDQAIGFLGGLDLCYGRWDDNSHKLEDQGPEEFTWPGIDYCNLRITDFVDVLKFEQSDLDRKTQQRLPWHDIALRIVGEPVIDMVRHFIQYWNHVCINIEYHNKGKNMIDIEPPTKNASIFQKFKSGFTQKQTHNNLSPNPFTPGDAAYNQPLLEDQRQTLGAKNSRSSRSTGVQDNQKPALQNAPVIRARLNDENLNEDEYIKSLQISLYGADGVSGAPTQGRKFDKIQEESKSIIKEEDEQSIEHKSEQLIYKPSSQLLEHQSRNIQQIDSVNLSVSADHSQSVQKSKGVEINLETQSASYLRSRQRTPSLIQLTENNQRSLTVNDLFLQQNQFQKKQKNYDESSPSPPPSVKTLANNATRLTAAVTNPSPPVATASQLIPKSMGLSADLNGQLNLDHDWLHLDKQNSQSLFQRSNSQPKNRRKQQKARQLDPEFIEIIKKMRHNKAEQDREEREHVQLLQKAGVRQSNSDSGSQMQKPSKTFSKVSSAKESVEKIQYVELDEGQLEQSHINASTTSSPNSVKPQIDPNRDHHQIEGTCSVRMLRSASLWSIGVNRTENSIHSAYVLLIAQAQHYIYIENQFFISAAAGGLVENQISSTLVERIKKAHRMAENFVVYVIMPLLPGFAGEIDGNAGVMKMQLYYEYATICRGAGSILQCLKAAGIEDTSKYINFFGLRQHAVLNGHPVTEQIYVHSKLMIVDDQQVIIGSANINDRSLLGNRDSEVAMLIEDKDLLDSRMNGERYQAAKFAYTLRQSLFEEHFALSKSDSVDPVNQKLLNRIIMQTSYRQIFRCYPDDEVLRISDLDTFRRKANKAEYPERMQRIIGSAVSFPLQFMECEDLTFSYTETAKYISTITWT